ncbi:MAG: hypothetical protein ACREJR_05795, partial [Candidatus Rokuibacteriota bacterium]
MKRALALLVGGVLILGSVLAAHAQAPTVSFGGQMRVYGFAFDNITDFTDSTSTGGSRDSNSFYFQRWRLWTNVESADKKAKAVWGLEVGDITWGANGGASGGEYRGCPGQAAGFTPVVTIPPPAGSPPGTPPTTATVSNPVTGANGGAVSNTRVGPGSGGCLGADGVNVETKHAYIWADTGQWLPGSSVTLGIQSIVFMTGPLGGYFDDDGAAIKLNMKFDPVDVEVYTAKVGEGARPNADDADMYVARVGANVSKDIRVTLEGMVVDEKSLPGQDFGDTFFVGATVGAKLGDIQLDGAVVYGMRAFAPALGASCNPCSEEGFGAFVTARFPVGPVSLFVVGWYTTGDDTVGPAGCVGAGSNAGCSAQGAARTLTKDSDKLPIPESGAGWFGGGGPYIAEWLFGNSSIGAPSIGQVQYADPTGTWGAGASVSYAITPALSVGGGAAYVMATDAAGVYG